MATSKYFKHGINKEQDLLEDLVVESIKHRGMDLMYIPRTIVDVNELFSEDRFSTFDEVFEIEMYPINQTGYEGQGDLLSKFGIQIDHTGTFIVARRRWSQESKDIESLQLSHRPSEGDMLYYPLSKSLFKINHVEPSSPFFQLSSRYVWTLKVSLVDYTYHEINTGNSEIDTLFTSINSEMIPEFDSEGELIEVEVGEKQRRHKGHNEIMTDKATTLIDWDSSDPFGEK